jgi:hypothetical protein
VYLFLRGAEMQPERIRSQWPEARFVARGKLSPQPLGAVAAPSGAEYETWGVIVEAPNGSAIDEARPAVTDDGRFLHVVVPVADDADPAAVVAAARYWELPPPYVRRLMRAAAMAMEDRSDG